MKHNLPPGEKFLSLGAGVQSSTLLFMYENGHLPDPPKHAIFADTMSEPAYVYTWLELLKKKITKIQIHIVSKGSLEQDTLAQMKQKWGFSDIPFFIKKSEADYLAEKAEWVAIREKVSALYPDKNWGDLNLPPRPRRLQMATRRCTQKYKIRVINAKIKELCGVKYHKMMTTKADVVIGISLDEIERCRDSQVNWIQNRYPLVENKITREDCLKYLKTLGLNPPKSSCYFCPYRNDVSWIQMRDHFPQEFARAVEFDKNLREGKVVKDELYVHSSCLPLGEVVFKKETGMKKRKNSHGFSSECEGMCGV